MSTPVDFDAFMTGQLLPEVNLAAYLGTDNQRTFPENNPAKPAPYREVPYGSDIALLLTIPGSKLAIQSEIERGMEHVGLPGSAVMSDRIATATTVDATLTVDPLTGVFTNG